MNGFLLDTNIAIRASKKSVTLSSQIRRAIERGPLYLSVVSYWEVIVKHMKGTLEVGDPRLWWKDAIEQLSVIPLLLRPEHVTEIWSLPRIHEDPFDRALIAQAQVEELTMLTTDLTIAEYASPRLRVLE